LSHHWKGSYGCWQVITTTGIFKTIDPQLINFLSGIHPPDFLHPTRLQAFIRKLQQTGLETGSLFGKINKGLDNHLGGVDERNENKRQLELKNRAIQPVCW